MSESSSNGSSFNVVGLIVILGIIVVAAAIILPAINHTGCRNRRPMANSTQLRGIQQGMVVFAQSNRFGGNDGYYPGLDSQGNVLPNSSETGFSGDGTHPAARLWIMLEANSFTPEYIINPADTAATEVDSGSESYNPLAANNYSYALLDIRDRHAERIEWKETLNTSAYVISDRAIGTDRSDISSVWTDLGSGDWRGTVTCNDNSTSFETSAEFEDTQYSTGNINPLDHLFENDPTADDAYLVHEDATNAYSTK